MQRRASTLVALLVATAPLIGGCAADPDPRPEPSGPRAVVLAEHPVALESDQQDTVVWPIWGGAFTPDEVTLRGRLEPGGEGASGLVIAGPGDPEARVTVELVAADGAWSVRETDGSTVLQEEPLADGTTGELVLDITADSVTVAAGGDETTLELAGPLAADGEAAGLYAYLEPGATLDLLELELSQPLPRHPELGTPLRELAAGKGIDIGSALDIWPPLHDIGFESMLGEQFSSATPTELYWATTRGEDEDYFFVPADLSMNYATVHDLSVTAMFLVWDFELPQWVLDIAATGDAETLGAVYDDHITTLVSRYRDQADAWVVVNEGIWGPFDTGESEARLAQTIWQDVLGDEHIERAFRVADEADPDAVLMYNETGAEVLGDKADFLYDMVSDFMERDVPIDAVGLQFHIDSANPPDLESARQNMQRFADLGLDVYITELDVMIYGTTDDQLELQAEIYADVVDACLQVSACKNTTVFGFSDRYSWDELGEAAPLMFTEDYVAKPAFPAVQEALR
ncbi:endo-1,4-beta-xylanase [Lysobacter korlensis]|uniref:endo-1,4-beta-xylanase n=1 Tax=Lysobacter korlensis TaxID=553636 RepID=A0ABV6RWK3_9GAMM